MLWLSSSTQLFRDVITHRQAEIKMTEKIKIDNRTAHTSGKSELKLCCSNMVSTMDTRNGAHKNHEVIAAHTYNVLTNHPPSMFASMIWLRLITSSSSLRVTNETIEHSLRRIEVQIKRHNFIQLIFNFVHTETFI